MDEARSACGYSQPIHLSTQLCHAASHFVLTYYLLYLSLPASTKPAYHAAGSKSSVRVALFHPRVNDHISLTQRTECLFLCCVAAGFWRIKEPSYLFGGRSRTLAPIATKREMVGAALPCLLAWLVSRVGVAIRTTAATTLTDFCCIRSFVLRVFRYLFYYGAATKEEKEGTFTTYSSAAGSTSPRTNEYH